MLFDEAHSRPVSDPSWEALTLALRPNLRWEIYMRIAKRIGALMGAMLIGSVLQAADRLTLYCSPQIEWCELMVNTFEKQTGIRVSMTRKSSGETLAQIKAEKSNPKGDVWWGGTGDPHLQAAEEGLTEVYNSSMNSLLVTTILSPLSPLKPTASFTNEVIFSFSSSFKGSVTLVPSGV